LHRFGITTTGAVDVPKALSDQIACRMDRELRLSRMIRRRLRLGHSI
jgi:hypothetical protein